MPKIREIVLMGGAMREGGNTTPAAEFNILVDPPRRARRLSLGPPDHHLGPRCDAPGADHAPAAWTRSARWTTKRGRAVAAMLSFYSRHDVGKYGGPGAPLHDPCTVAYLLRPDLFQGKAVNVEIEIGSGLTMGASVVDFLGRQRPARQRDLDARNRRRRILRASDRAPRTPSLGRGRRASPRRARPRSRRGGGLRRFRCPRVPRAHRSGAAPRLARSRSSTVTESLGQHRAALGRDLGEAVGDEDTADLGPGIVHLEEAGAHGGHHRGRARRGTPKSPSDPGTTTMSTGF